MTISVLGSILLYCGKNGSDKDYLIEVYKDTDNHGEEKLYRAKYGPASNPKRSVKEYGPYTRQSVEKLISQKVAKSYEITRVNTKPFTSGFSYDALRLIEDGDAWGSVQTAQPTQKIRQREVLVTFDPGQFAPIW